MFAEYPLMEPTSLTHVPRKILIVEDDGDIADLLKLHLGDLGYLVDHANNGLRAFAMVSRESYDLVLLDIMLPGLDGLEICRRIRQQQDYTHVLMVSAKVSEFDRVLGLELGADDYLTKPFAVSELLARVKAIFRRMNALTDPGAQYRQVLHRGALVIDFARRTVTVKGQGVELTAKEFDLLAYFARHPGQVFTRSQLLDAVWGYRHEGCEHTVNSHINRLRRKIEDNPRKPHYILTVWSVGYKFVDDRAPAGAMNEQA